VNFDPETALRAAGALSIPPPPPRNVQPAGKRLVFAVDATASREIAWNAAKGLTDSLVKAVPEGLEMALAVHGGCEVHTFTNFTRDARPLRTIANSIKCIAGDTRLIPILRESYARGGVGTVVYIGDQFEENEKEALAVASVIGRSGTRIIILHDKKRAYLDDSEIFQKFAHVSNGAVLPFDHAAIGRLKDLLAAIAVMTVHGIEHVKAHQNSIAGAALLLSHMKG
jgi:hypothetical protein